jgi:hypothetical protein
MYIIWHFNIYVKFILMQITDVIQVYSLWDANALYEGLFLQKTEQEDLGYIWDGDIIWADKDEVKTPIRTFALDPFQL